MANIVIKEILAADTVSDLVDKINFNFDQLLLNGGGPSGPIGGTGIQGPVGPRGTTWFTSLDVYTTSTSPTWSGTSQPANNSALAGYPQYKGDPNKFKSSGSIFPDNTFVIGYTGKFPKSGDLYLQEGDDNYATYSSTDGDVWEFNAVTSTWSFTGVNIKGDSGGTGASGASDWVRDTDSSSNDLLRPLQETGNDPIVRVVLGADESSITAAALLDDGTGSYADNILTVYQENPSSTSYQIALTDSTSVTAPSVSPGDYASMYTGSNRLYIQGFANSSGNNNRTVNLLAPAGNIYLEANNPLTSAQQTLTLDIINRKLSATGGVLDVSCAPTIIPAGVVEHSLSDGTVSLKVKHNQSSTYGGWTSGESIRLYSFGTTSYDMYLQELAANRLGVGTFSSARTSGKLGVNNNISTIPSIVVGTSWSTNASIASSNQGGDTIANSVFIQGQVSVGTLNSSNNPVKLGDSALNSIATRSSVVVQNGLLGFGTFISGTGPSLASSFTGTIGNYFISPGSFLSSNSIAGTGPVSDLDGALIIAGGKSIQGIGTNLPFSGGLFTNLRYNPGIAFKSTTRQVLINTQKFTNSGSTDSSNLMSSGGAIIGKLTKFTGDTLNGHEDAIANNNIIIGFPQGTSATSPRLILTTAGSSTTTSTANSTYISTPLWCGSMLFNQSDEIHTATLYSKSSYQNNVTYGGYQNYLPSISAQNKLVHGLGYNLLSNSILDGTQNIYSNGVGLEVETLITKPTYSLTATELKRSPVITNNSGNPIRGNRSMLVTKRSVIPGTNVSTLFEISPTNNVSVGEAIRFPLKSIVYGSVSKLSSPSSLGSAYASLDQSSTQAFNSTSSDTWHGGAPNKIPFILPDSNRSLHINKIEIDNNLGLSAENPINYDLASGLIRAGIVIRTDSVTSSNVNINGAFADYYDSITGYKHQITTSLSFLKNDVTLGLGTAEPLGMKPGYVTYSNSGTSNQPRVIKGSDLILEGGDVFYVDTFGVKFTRPGDVFITAGTAYKNQYQTGYANARTGLNAVVTSTERRNFGSIYLGSKATNDQYNGYLRSGIVKSGLVYVGYQSDDTRTFNNSSEEFSPKGSASLNVASSDTSTTTTRDSEALISAGKALNIQQGDIVSRNADAGWIEVDLTTVGISGGGTSQILQCWDNSLNRNARISGSGVTPKWLLRYKVIGYTVHFIASLEGVIWRTTLSGSDAQLVFINAANNLFGTTPSTSLMPRPKAGDISSVYSTLNNYSLPGTNRSQSFHGTGTLILRNSQANWPVNGAGIGGIGVVTPIEAAWDNVNNRISIFKNGSPAILPNSSSSAPLNAYDPQLISNVLSFRNYLIPLNGGEIAGGTSVASNVDVWTDIYFSGTYELDPQFWYGTYNP
jgi:hypothetical protein